jgi:hypothetical protein
LQRIDGRVKQPAGVAPAEFYGSQRDEISSWTGSNGISCHVVPLHAIFALSWAVTGKIQPKIAH